MCVVGKHSYVLNESGRTAQVNPFSPDYEPMEVPIVDAAILYECPYEGQEYVLVILNALRVNSMQHNLIPPFIMREAGLTVKDIPKIHVKDPDVTDHAISLDNHGIRIPLSLWGIFSFFPSRKPTLNELQLLDDHIVLITPEGTWDPHNDTYARNEENMLDWEGNIVDPRDRVHILLEHVDEDPRITIADASSAEVNAINHLDTHHALELNVRDTSKQGCSIYDHHDLHTMLNDKRDASVFGAAVGSQTPWTKHTLFLDHIDDNDATIGELDFDQFMVSGTAGKPSGVTPEHLSKIWKIDIDTATRTIAKTTQLCKRSTTPNLSRNYSTNDRMLRYRRIHQHFFMDTFFATTKGCKSTRGHTCMQIFVTDKGFVYVVPMRSKKEVPQAIKAFAKELGAPDAIVCDAAREQTSHELRSFCNKIGTTLRVLEENTPWANRAELYIGLIKEAVRRDMHKSACPLVLWDYCVERRARINNLTAKDLFQLDGQTPHFSVTGEVGDISNLCQFDWYEWVYYREGSASFPLPREVLGRALGPAKGEGNEMAQWILKANGHVVPRRTVRPLTRDEVNLESEQRKRKIFDELIEKRWGTCVSPPPTAANDTSDSFVPYEDDDEPATSIPTIDDPVDANGRALDQQPAYDVLIDAELMLPQRDQLRPAKVRRRTADPDGRVTGTYNSNPLMNTLTYDVEFDDGEVKEYAANVIAENLLSQVDDEGFTLTHLDSIVSHRKLPDALSSEDAYAVTKRGAKRLRKTTRGWDLQVKWTDGSTQWVPLSDMKEAYPVQTADYAKSESIHTEPAFAWWVPFTLRKRDVIISQVRARTRKTTHKYGIEIPCNVEHAYELDKANGNDFWAKSIRKEMTNVGVAFEILEPSLGQKVPPGWRKVSGHLIFDVKMTLERKSRWVLDGHLTEKVSNISTYAGVVSRESVRIALTYAALNGIDVTAADIRNAYLQAPSSQKDYVICGLEFGKEHVGKPALIRRALYGGKTAGRDFRNHLRACMRHLGFESCLADPDVWMRPAMRADGTEYWEYVLLYTDDTLVISECGEKVLRNEIGRYFELKEESIGPPDIYRGGRLRRVQLDNGVNAWAFGSSQYVQAAVKNVEAELKSRDRKLPQHVNAPMQNGYRPEVDVSPELCGTDATLFQSLIGVLRWIVELGRVDICCELSMLSSHLALPREGHLDQLFHMFAYLKKYHNAEMVFDPSEPDIDESIFARQDWTTSEFGQTLSETLPANMPQPRGFGFTMRAFVDADHATDSMTRKSRTGFLVYLNSAPIFWTSKKQQGVETSSFGSEFTAMKQCTEYVRGLRYKLRMMGIPCEGPTYIYGDNKSVLYNTSLPDSTLKKKSQSLAYHFVREGTARDEWRTAYVNTHENPSDLLTKPLQPGEKRRGFVRMILHHIFGSSGE